MRYRVGLIVAGAGLALCAPATADVKAGVDAWSRGDWAAAVREWRGPADAGDPDAQFNLAQAYKLGRGVPADAAQAEALYRKAAQQGHPQAADNLGLALFQNNKRAEAVQWLERSAERGEPRAQFVFGTMLFNGDVVQKDWRRAYALMTRASASGLPQASATLAEMDKYVPLQDRQQAQALAREYEAKAGRAPLPGGTQVATTTPAQRPTPAPTPVARAQATPTPPRAQPTPAPRAPTAAPAVRDGGWRVQLGAFRDAGNARSLWSDLSGKSAFAGSQPFYERAGNVTRLQAGPFASSAEATRACAAIRPAQCVPVKR